MSGWPAHGQGKAVKINFKDGKKLKAAIAIDDWKLPIFERHLSESGYQYEKHPGLTKDTLTLTVFTSSVDELEKVVRSANAEAAKRRIQ